MQNRFTYNILENHMGAIVLVSYLMNKIYFITHTQYYILYRYFKNRAIFDNELFVLFLN